jgi:hypothetical protein
MSDENKRIDIGDLPRTEEELTDGEAKNVEGGAGFMYFKDSPIVGEATGNTIGGSLATDVSKPVKP